MPSPFIFTLHDDAKTKLGVATKVYSPRYRLPHLPCQPTFVQIILFADLN